MEEDAGITRNKKPTPTAIHILLDTNALWNSFFGGVSIALKTLSKLAEQKKINIHISEIVLREVTSQIPTAIEECGIADARRTFKELHKLTPPNKRLAINEMERLLDQHILELEEEITKKIKDWIVQANVNVHIIDSSHTEKVIEAYFSGASPFKKPKSREDFPDAFIWQVFTDLAAQYEEIYFVCFDEAMAKSAAKINQKVRIHSNIVDLLKSGHLPITATQDDLNLARKCTKYLSDIAKIFKVAMHTSLDQFSFKIDESVLPDVRYNQLTIEAVSSVGEVQIEATSLVPTGGGNLLVGFSVPSVVRASYASASGPGVPGTFNILEMPRMVIGCDIQMAGSFVLKPAFEKQSTGEVLDITNTRVELEEMEVLVCKTRSWNPSETMASEEEAQELSLRSPDSFQLERALQLCRGIILVTGHRRSRRAEAAASLLLEAMNFHPNNFFMTSYRKPRLLRDGCIPFPWAPLSLTSRSRCQIGLKEVYEKIEETGADGALVDVINVIDFSSASTMVIDNGTLIIGITTCEKAEECDEFLKVGMADPLAIVEVT